MVEGVTNGFKQALDFRGVGYRAEFGNGELKMTVGLSHQPIVKIPESINVTIDTTAPCWFMRLVVED